MTVSLRLHNYTRFLGKIFAGKISYVCFFKCWNATINQQTTKKIFKYP